MWAKRLVIFDLDGVLVDTHPHHVEAWRRACREVIGVEPSARFFEEIRGRSRKCTLSLLFEDGQLAPEVEVRLLGRKAEIYADAVRRCGREQLLVDGALSLLMDLKASGCRLALYSASTVAREVLAVAGLESYFSYVSDGWDAGLPKPFPDRLTRMLCSLEVSTDSAILLEDSELGIAAAKAAGIRALFIGSAIVACPSVRRIDYLTADRIGHLLQGVLHDRSRGATAHAVDSPVVS